MKTIFYPFVPLVLATINPVKNKNLRQRLLYISISILPLTLSMLGTSASQASQSKRPNPQRTSQTISAQYSFDNYRQECLQRASREGLPTETANELCSCTISSFRNRYTIQQFRTLVQKSKTDKAAAQTLSEVGEACFEQVLYEQ
jgi:hypothetical protein